MTIDEARAELSKLRYALDSLPDDASIISMHASFISGTWMQLGGLEWFRDGEPYEASDHSPNHPQRFRVVGGVKILALE